MINNHVSKGKNKKYQFSKKKIKKIVDLEEKKIRYKKIQFLTFVILPEEDIIFFNSSTLKNALMQSEVKNYHSTFCIIQNSY